MKFTGWKLPAIFRSRESLERENYLRSSLDTSFLLSEQLANWSTSNNPKARRFAMKFHTVWQHSDCPVMKWYRLQTCTEFKSIQHWRNLDTQFYHEFLIILLTDGSACRIERMGEGSRADAIRRIGCTAYDLIQWFSPEDYAATKWSRGSQEMLIQVDFPRNFDLLDVLAVCYTIQHEYPRASVYTLQRYNCYFLCNTILVVLTRHVAEWETLLTDASWGAIVDDMIDELRHLSLLPIEQQKAVEFFALGFCSLLRPESQDPAGFLLEPLKSRLKTWALERIKKALAELLWCKHFDAVENFELDLHFCGVVDEMAGGLKFDLDTGTLSILCRSGEFGQAQDLPRQIDVSSIQSMVSKEFLAVWSKVETDMAALMMTVCEMRDLEEPPSRLRLLSTSMIGPLGFIFPMRAIAYCVTQKASQAPVEQLGRICSRFSVRPAQLASSLPLAERLNIAKLGFWFLQRREDPDAFNDVNLQFISDSISLLHTLPSYGAERLFSILQIFLNSESGLPKVPATLEFLNHYFPMLVWGPCFGACMTRLKKRDFHTLLACKSDTIVTHSRTETGVLKTVQTIAEFQKYVQERIYAHAKRVEYYHLAAAPLVQQDLERSMTQVWASLPLGFGARPVQPAASFCEEGAAPVLGSESSLTTLLMVSEQ